MPMPPRTRASARVETQISAEAHKAMAATTQKVWHFPGFLFQAELRCASLVNHLFTTKFTDPAILGSQMSEEEKVRISANNSLSALFKALIFHQKYYHTRKSDLIAFLQQITLHDETRGKIVEARHFERVCIKPYISARQAYLTQSDVPVPKVQTVLTGLVDKWITFLNTHHHHVAPIDNEYVNLKNECLGLVHNGALMNAGQVVEEHGKPSGDSSSESSGSEFSDDSDSDESGDDQVAVIKPEPREDESSDNHVPFIKSEPRHDSRESNALDEIGGSSTHRLLAVGDTPSQHKRKAPSKLEQTFLKRGRAFHTSSSPSDTSNEVSEFESYSDSDSEFDPKAADIERALADVKASAERHHSRQLAKLRKMKFRHSSQKKQLASLQKQMTEFRHADATQASLSATVKGNSKLLKDLMKDLEQQQKKIKKVKADIGEIKASKAGEPDANTQNNMDKMKARVKAEVRGTWTGAAVELSNTKRELLKVMDDQGRQLNEQNERLDSLESHIAEQTSVTDRHERAILDHGDISVQQVHSVSIIERSVTSILDRQENRLSSVEMRLADQANQHAQYQTPTSPRNWFPKHSKANEASELRGIIASQGGALRVQGKQLGEMSKEIASLRELCKDLAERVKQTCNKPEITGFHGYTREVARLKEIRQLLPAMSGVQPSGEEPVGSGHAVSQVKDFKPTSLEDVSAEIANYKHFRMTLTPVLARQAWEEAAEE